MPRAFVGAFCFLTYHQKGLDIEGLLAFGCAEGRLAALLAMTVKNIEYRTRNIE